MNRKIHSPCRQNPDAWFPEGHIGQGARREMEYAANVCRTFCSIQTSCLRLALRCEAGQPATSRYGVYGGLTPAERAALDPALAKPTEQALAA